MDCKWEILHNIVQFCKGPCMRELMKYEQEGKAGGRKAMSHFGATVPMSVEWALHYAIGERKWCMGPGNKLYMSALQVAIVPNTPPVCGGLQSMFPHTPPVCGGLHSMFAIGAVGLLLFLYSTYPACMRWILWFFFVLSR